MTKTFYVSVENLKDTAFKYGYVTCSNSLIVKKISKSIRKTFFMVENKGLMIENISCNLYNICVK